MDDFLSCESGIVMRSERCLSYRYDLNQSVLIIDNYVSNQNPEEIAQWIENFALLERVGQRIDNWEGRFHELEVLNGFDHTGAAVSFGVRDYTIQNHRYCAQVGWLLRHRAARGQKFIREMVFYGCWVDIFCRSAFDTEELNKSTSKTAGCYRFNDASVRLSIVELKEVITPLGEVVDKCYAMKAVFSRPLELTEALQVYEHVETFLKFAAYWGHAYIQWVELVLCDDTQEQFEGVLVTSKPVVNPDALATPFSVVFPWFIFKDKTAFFLERITEGALPTRHLPQTKEDLRKFTFDRLVKVVGAFEQTYRIKYKDAGGRSEHYHRAQQLVDQALENLKESTRAQGLRQEAEVIRDFQRSIKKWKMGLKEMLRKAFADHQHLMQMLFEVRYYWLFYEQTREQYVNEWAERLSDCRNGSVHQTINSPQTSDMMDDLFLLDELILIMWFAISGIDDETIKSYGCYPIDGDLDSGIAKRDWYALVAMNEIFLEREGISLFPPLPQNS